MCVYSIHPVAPLVMIHMVSTVNIPKPSTKSALLWMEKNMGITNMASTYLKFSTQRKNIGELWTSVSFHNIGHSTQSVSKQLSQRGKSSKTEQGRISIYIITLPRMGSSSTSFTLKKNPVLCLTLCLLLWRTWWAPNNASKWQMGFNWAFKGLRMCRCH
jgi:hypothetical protein